MSINDNDIASMYPMMMAAIRSKQTSPWEYVKNWAMSDKDPSETLELLNERMQNRWPGNYKIVRTEKWNGKNYYVNDYVFEFETPADKMVFALKYV